MNGNIRPRLWMLGDSHAEPFHGIVDTWIQMLADALDMEIGLVSGMKYGGTSLPYLCQIQWTTMVPLMQPGDMIIAVLTHTARTWFFAEHPHISHLGWIDPKKRNPALPREITYMHQQAMQDYYLHFNRQDLHCIWLESWFYYLDAVANRLGTKAVVIDAFHEATSKINTGNFNADHHTNIIRASGHLHAVSSSEQRDDTAAAVMRDFVSLHYRDPRFNHLLRPNHEILSAKVQAALCHGHPIDLTSGFKSHIMGAQDLLDDDWLLENIGDSHHDRLSSDDRHWISRWLERHG